eukprot:m.177428 g.177428  ORF g.177428 m.177428 type:complete len:453 (+) comp16572_c0_seq2:3153-4511(+)
MPSSDFMSDVFRALKALKWIVYALVFVLALFAFSYAFSVFIYGLLYLVFVPKPAHEWPLYFDFPSPALAKQIQQRPVTHVYLSRDAHNALRAGQAYDFAIELELPNSDINQRVGMFMVSLWLSKNKEEAQASKALAVDNGLMTTTGDLVVAEPGVGASRPAMLPYNSGLLHTLRRLMFAPLYLFGLLHDTSTVSLALMDDVLVKHPGYHWASVSLSHPKLQVIGAKLTAQTQMRGATYWMYHWFLSSFLVGTFTMAFMLTGTVLLILIACYWRQIQQSLEEWRRQVEQEEIAPETRITDGLVYDPDLDMDVLPPEEGVPHVEFDEEGNPHLSHLDGTEEEQGESAETQHEQVEEQQQQQQQEHQEWEQQAKGLKPGQQIVTQKGVSADEEETTVSDGEEELEEDATLEGLELDVPWDGDSNSQQPLEPQHNRDDTNEEDQPRLRLRTRLFQE